MEKNIKNDNKESVKIPENLTQNEAISVLLKHTTYSLIKKF